MYATGKQCSLFHLRPVFKPLFSFGIDQMKSRQILSTARRKNKFLLPGDWEPFQDSDPNQHLIALLQFSLKRKKLKC